MRVSRTLWLSKTRKYHCDYIGFGIESVTFDAPLKLLTNASNNFPRILHDQSHNPQKVNPTFSPVDGGKLPAIEGYGGFLNRYKSKISLDFNS